MKLLLLHCTESGQKVLARLPHTGYRLPSTVRTMELKCTGRINEELLLSSLEDGFDAVLVVGCHRENCKYLDGNLRAERRVQRVARMLADAGITDKKVDMLLVGPDEGAKLAARIARLLESPGDAAAGNPAPAGPAAGESAAAVGARSGGKK